MRCTRSVTRLFLVILATISVAAAQEAVTTPPANTSGITITRTSTLGGTIADQQRARLAEKLALVEHIMTSVAARAEDSTAEQRQWLRERLYGTPLVQLQAMGTPSTFQAATAALTKTAVTAKELGDPQTDLVYRPMTPCRYIDTRNVGGAIVGMRDFDLSNTGATYGGSGACDPKAIAPFAAPILIAAINVNVTIIGPGTAPGFIGARPAGSTNTTSLVNWYQGGPTVQAANAGVVSTGGTAQVEFFGSPVNIVVDVLGVFTKPDHATPKVIERVEWTFAPGTVGGNFPIAADRPSQLVSVVTTPAYRGVSQVTIFQCCGSTPQFLEWIGLNSPVDASIATGFAATPGALVLKLDFSGKMFLEVNDATSLRLHNTTPVTQSGVFTIVEY